MHSTIFYQTDQAFLADREIAHTRQIRGVGHVLGPIDSTWDFPQELSEDVVQLRFGADSAYVTAYTAVFREPSIGAGELLERAIQR